MVWTWYNIIISVNATEALEQFEDFEPYTNKPSKEFLQFAEKYLSLNKADNKNNPAFGSCLLRVLYTFNSKCIEEKIGAEVMMVHEWDNLQKLPEIGNLLIEFQTFLVDRKLKAEINQKKSRRNYVNNSLHIPNTTSYVEKLLSMQIADHRKFAVSLILAPYFVNIHHYMIIYMVLLHYVINLV
ncbi:MAG TPA: hypothetical protein VFY64_05945 [Nitrososphaeraceae archaeon]|nr:hypothetical protein [Nitrososphaeraceae archaeon]